MTIARLVRRSRVPDTAAATGSNVTLTLVVSANVTEGRVDERELHKWICDAVGRYHLWRNGHVGLDCVGKITLPEMVIDGSPCIVKKTRSR